MKVLGPSGGKRAYCNKVNYYWLITYCVMLKPIPPLDNEVFFNITQWLAGFLPIQDECLAMDDIPRPSMCKEELFVLAVRVRFHLAFHYLQLCVKIPTYPRPPKNTQSPHLLMISKRILTSSAHILMGASDRAFIYQCLQDCLWSSGNKSNFNMLLSKAIKPLTSSI